MNINETLALLGLSENETKVYLLLARSGWSTVLQLSRLSLIKRTTLYRILENLVRKGLVETQVAENTTLYNAFDTKSLDGLISEKEKELNSIKNSLKNLEAEFKLIASLSPQKIGLRFYKGKAGIQQSEWNMTKKPNSQVCIIASPTSINLKEAVGNNFAEEIRQKYIDQNIKLLEISNEDTAIKIGSDGTVAWTNNKEYIRHHYTHRVLSKDVLNITSDIILYNDKICLYSVEEKERVVIEITSNNLKSMLFQIFKLLWNKSKAIDNFAGENI